MMISLLSNLRRANGSDPYIRHCSLLFIVLLFLFLADGCKPVAPENAAQVAASGVKTDSNTTSVTIDSVNYMHERGVKYTLYDLSTAPPTAIGGSIVEFLATGGDKGCCLALPKTWRPGIKVRLDWDEADRERTYPEKYSRELEIPRYDQPADLYVVFYPKNEVELVVSPGEPGSQDWRGRIKQTPWDQCIATYGRKPCKAALPVYGGLSWGEMQGYCTDLKKEGGDMENCIFALNECVRNYEDEDRCHKTLWGATKK